MALVIQSHYRPSTSLFGGKITTPPTLTRIHISGTLEVGSLDALCDAFDVGLDRIAFDIRTLLPEYAIHLEP